MKQMRSASPDDHVTLQMENDLLGHEVRHLRARLAAVTREADGLRRREKSLDDAGREAATQRERADRLQQSDDDLRWLLARLDGLPVAPVLRRYAGFRTLLERYGAGRADGRS